MNMAVRQPDGKAESISRNTMKHHHPPPYFQKPAQVWLTRASLYLGTRSRFFDPAVSSVAELSARGEKKLLKAKFKGLRGEEEAYRTSGLDTHTDSDWM